MCLKDFAKKHRSAMVLSIHQPNQDLLMMFDKIYALAKGGRCVYNGKPADLRAHLLSCSIPCADWQIPIEVLMRITSRKNRKNQIQSIVLVLKSL